MSPASLVLGTFAMLSIVLATTSGKEGDVMRRLEINATTENVVMNSSTEHRTRVEENIGIKRIKAAGMSMSDALSTNDRTNDAISKDGHLVGNSEIATAASATVKNETEVSVLSGEEVTTPRQERLIGLIDNRTNDNTSKAMAKGAITRRFSRNETSSDKFSASESSTTFVEASIRRPVVEIISTSTIGTTQLTTLTLGKVVGFKTRNDLVGGTFHEIKSGKKINSINPGYIGSKIVKPNIASALGKYTPYFEDGQKEVNVTSRIGNTVILDCEIGMLGNKTVTWSYHSADVIRLLTVGRNAYSIDQRISLFFRYPTNWRLRIQYATPRDSGLYECQVATFPPLVKKIHLLITAPILVIMDDSGRIKSGERHLKAGSAFRLRCEARDVPERYNETVIWTRGDEILNEDVSENRTAEYLDGREIQVIVSTIVVEKATSRHAGNYSCVVPEKARATVAVHVLNGELPAAVHDGNGVSKSVLNLWLVHLTVSYVFSR